MHELFRSENISFLKKETRKPSKDSSLSNVTIFTIRMLKKRNWLSVDLIRDFNTCLDILSDQICDDSVLITTGSGRYFSVGLDLPNWRHDLTDLIRLHYFPLLARIIDLPLPLVAIVNGHAVAGGMVLSLIHDYRYYSYQSDEDGKEDGKEKEKKDEINSTSKDDIIMSMNEIELPAWIPSPMLSVLKTKIGDPQLLRECIMNGKKIYQKEALEARIIDGMTMTTRDLYSILKNKNQGLALCYIRREWMKDAYELFKNPQDIKYILRPNMSKL